MGNCGSKRNKTPGPSYAPTDPKIKEHQKKVIGILYNKYVTNGEHQIIKPIQIKKEDESKPKPYRETPSPFGETGEKKLLF